MDDATGAEVDGNALCFPDGVLINILRRVQCRRALADFRRVCRGWRSMVDAHKLLLPYMFPRHFPGVFTNNLQCHNVSSFFAPPASRSRDGVFQRPRFRHQWAYVLDSCNGLLLLKDEHSLDPCYVCNPATVRCARLPRPPREPRWFEGPSMFLAFDPAVSRHHQVFLFPECAPPPDSAIKTDVEQPRIKVEQNRWWIDLDLEKLHFAKLFGEEELSDSDNEQEEIEVVREKIAAVPVVVTPEEDDSDDTSPPSEEEDPSASQPTTPPEPQQGPKNMILPLLVFSSRTGEWESRRFVPRRCSHEQEHLYDAVIEGTTTSKHYDFVWKSSEYWRGSLYVHCRGHTLTILHCSEGTYDMVRLPGPEKVVSSMSIYELPDRSVMASYERGVRYVAVDQCELRVWTLLEEGLEPAWVMSCEANLTPYFSAVMHSPYVEPPAVPMVQWEAIVSGRHLASLFEDHFRWEVDMDDDDDNEDEGITDEEEDDGRLGDTTTAVGDVNDDEDGKGDYDVDDEEEDVKDEEDGEGDNYNGWNSDEDNFIDELSGRQYPEEEYGQCQSLIMGLHPYKDVLLLTGTAVAYHLETSKMQYLGWRLVRDPFSHAHGVIRAFPYRPCYVDALSSDKLPKWQALVPAKLRRNMEIALEELKHTIGGSRSGIG